jgi:two-component system, sensor histidine kinase RegB
MTSPKHSRQSWISRLGLSEVWVRGDLSSQLLLSLRWLAVLGQGTTLLVAWRLGVAVPWWPCGIALGVTLVTNIALVWWLRQIGGRLGGGFFHVALWDVVVLTWLLSWTGGLENPFAIFYLVQMVIAVVALRASAAVGVGLVMALGCLFLWRVPRVLVMRNGAPLDTHYLAMGRFIALVLAGGCVLILMLAVRKRSHRLQKERERLRTELHSRDRFLSVAALATGFAHELGTPLGTIALAAEEMKMHPDAETVTVIVREAERCQRVLQRLREAGQEATGLSSEPCEVGWLVESALNELPPGQRQRVRTWVSTPEAKIACAGLREALLVLLRNALLSSGDDLMVELRVEQLGNTLRFEVQDQGAGFSGEMLSHWGEPFRSTREPGVGLGLGLFFVRRLASSAQGSVDVQNRPEGGACVTLRLPINPNSPN